MSMLHGNRKTIYQSFAQKKINITRNPFFLEHHHMLQSDNVERLFVVLKMMNLDVIKVLISICHLPFAIIMNARKYYKYSHNYKCSKVLRMLESITNARKYYKCSKVLQILENITNTNARKFTNAQKY
jgi:hypothetical protein